MWLQRYAFFDNNRKKKDIFLAFVCYNCVTKAKYGYNMAKSLKNPISSLLFDFLMPNK